MLLDRVFSKWLESFNTLTYPLTFGCQFRRAWGIVYVQRLRCDILSQRKCILFWIPSWSESRLLWIFLNWLAHSLVKGPNLMAGPSHDLLVVTVRNLRNPLVLAVVCRPIKFLLLLRVRCIENVWVRQCLPRDSHTGVRHAHSWASVVSVGVSRSNYWTQIRIWLSFWRLVLAALHPLSELKHWYKLAVVEGCSCQWLLLHWLFAARFLPWGAINDNWLWLDSLRFSSLWVHLDYFLFWAFILLLYSPWLSGPIKVK